MKKKLLLLLFCCVTSFASGQEKSTKIPLEKKEEKGQIKPYSLQAIPEVHQTGTTISVMFSRGTNYACVNIINKKTGASVYSLVHYQTDTINIDLSMKEEEEYLINIIVNKEAYSGSFSLVGKTEQ